MKKFPTLLETLKEGRKRVKAGWTQGTCARNAKGTPVLSYDFRAVEWCMSGAVMGRNMAAALHWLGYVIQLEMDPIKVGALQRRYPIADWNDAEDRTKEEVVAIFDEAIKRIEKGESI